MAVETEFASFFARWLTQRSRTFKISGRTLLRLRVIAATRGLAFDVLLAEALALEEIYSAELAEGRTLYVQDPDNPGTLRPIKTTAGVS